MIYNMYTTCSVSGNNQKIILRYTTIKCISANITYKIRSGYVY